MREELIKRLRSMADCVECKAIATAAPLGRGEFTTEGVKRVADKMRDDGQPVLASALMDLAEQRDTLRAQLAESREREGRMREALEIIAGRRQCADTTMSNVVVAQAALAAEKE